MILRLLCIISFILLSSCGERPSLQTKSDSPELKKTLPLGEKQANKPDYQK